MIEIQKVKLSIISMPLKRPFSTHLGTVNEREAIIIEVIDKDGISGFGETVAFSSPWYTEETVKTAYHIQKDFIIPKLLKHSLEHPSDFHKIFSFLRGNPMAKSGVETALWDLYAKKKGKSLSELLGGTQTEVLAGAVVATTNVEEALKQIETFLETGYERIKVKISPERDIEWLKEIRKVYPDIPLMADANSAYTLQDMDRLKALDEFNLLMIEQPLGMTDIVEHAELQKQMNTPICLDESITNFHDAKSAIQLGSCRVINIKVGRVGGLEPAKQIHNLCIEQGVQVWCGGMIEFGISKAHSITIASLPGFSLPGDLSSSTHYWEEDIVEPAIEMKDGKIQVRKQPGIGYKINRKRLKEVCIYEEIFQN